MGGGHGMGFLQVIYISVNKQVRMVKSRQYAIILAVVGSRQVEPQGWGREGGGGARGCHDNWPPSPRLIL